jgi:hypothetical protein
MRHTPSTQTSDGLSPSHPRRPDLLSRRRVDDGLDFRYVIRGETALAS